MARLALGLHALGLLALAACGADNELVPVDDGLAEPPAVREPPPTSSSSSAGSSGTPGPGGGSSSSGASSGAVPPTVEADCDPNANFKDYEPIPGLPPDASWLRLTGDELDAFFLRPGTGTPHVFEAKRTAIDQPFGTAIELGQSVNEGATADPLVTDDGLSLRFSHGSTVFVATRANRDAPFGGTTTILPNARAYVLARDGSIEMFSRFERVAASPFAPYRWIVQGQPPGSEIHRITFADENSDVYATWYEPLSRTAWVVRGDQTTMYGWDGSWNSKGATDFRVSWSSPNGCRLYGRFGDALKIHARIPSPPAAPDGGL